MSLTAGERYGLVLAGSYALYAHGLVHRPSHDLDFATNLNRALGEIAEGMVLAYHGHGFAAGVIGSTARTACLEVVTPYGPSRVDLLKEALQGQPLMTRLGMALSLEDAVGLKVRALHDRGLVRDLIDVYAAVTHFSAIELERLGAVHDPEFSLEELRDRIAGTEFVGDAEFRAYGLTDDQIREVRDWADGWQLDITDRLAETAWISAPAID